MKLKIDPINLMFYIRLGVMIVIGAISLLILIIIKAESGFIGLAIGVIAMVVALVVSDTIYFKLLDREKKGD